MTEPHRDAAGEAMPLRLDWTQTWPERAADYAARAPDYPDNVGRIYRHDDGTWSWAMNAHGHDISRNVGELHGVERSARAAAHMVEAAWFRAITGSALDHPAPKRNAYAMAKAGE